MEKIRIVVILGATIMSCLLGIGIWVVLHALFEGA